MKWNNIFITIFKELRGIVRDKKSFHKLLLYPAIIPAIILLFGFLFDYMDNSDYVVGINYKMSTDETSMVEEYDNISFSYYKDEALIKEAYDNKEINGYIIKEDNIYTIYTDYTTNSGQMVLSYVTTYLESYNKMLGNSYLEKNNIDADKVFNNIVIDSKSLAKEEGDSAFSIFFNLTITYVLMIVIMTAIVVATDATSGEKERGTLETILTFPVKSTEFVAGKYLATALLSAILGIISYFLMIPSMYLGKRLFDSFDDMSLTINISSVLLIIFVIVISAFLIAGVCMALSGKAKTYKEAQSSLQFVSLFPLIPYFIKIMEVDNNLFNFIPIANCGMALSDIAMNQVNISSLFIILVTTIIYTVIILIVISKQYKSEKTLFS